MRSIGRRQSVGSSREFTVLPEREEAEYRVLGSGGEPVQKKIVRNK